LAWPLPIGEEVTIQGLIIIQDPIIPTITINRYGMDGVGTGGTGGLTAHGGPGDTGGRDFKQQNRLNLFYIFY